MGRSTRPVPWFRLSSLYQGADCGMEQALSGFSKWRGVINLSLKNRMETGIFADILTSKKFLKNHMPNALRVRQSRPDSLSSEVDFQLPKDEYLDIYWENVDVELRIVQSKLLPSPLPFSCHC